MGSDQVMGTIKTKFEDSGAPIHSPRLPVPPLFSFSQILAIHAGLFF